MAPVSAHVAAAVVELTVTLVSVVANIHPEKVVFGAAASASASAAAVVVVVVVIVGLPISR